MSENQIQDADSIPNDPLSTELVYKAYWRVKLLLQDHARGVLINSKMVCNLHRLLFQDVWPLAGRLRGRYLPVDVTFGTTHHRGVRHDEVEATMTSLEEDTRGRVIRLDCLVAGNLFNPVEAVQLGGSFHGHIVRIHPFRDGNGRTSRLCLNYFAYRYGLVEFMVLGEKDPRYLEVLDWFLTRRDLDPLLNYLEARMIA